MLDSFKAAAVCLDSKPGDTAGNVRKAAEWCRQAAAEGAQLVVLPELSLTGFIPNHPGSEHEAWLRSALAAARRMAEPLTGPATAALADVARTTGLFVAAGLLEDAGNVLYNSYVLASPDGAVECWRKMHIPMFEMPFYNGGPGPGVAATPLGRLGANICFDALLPESTRLLAVQNVEVVLFPFAADPPPRTPAGWSAWAGPALRARCSENGTFGIACNYVGHVACAGAVQDFPGGAMVIGPRGEVLAEMSGPGGTPGMIVAEISRETLTAARSEPEYLFRFRRPELYLPLAGR